MADIADDELRRTIEVGQKVAREVPPYLNPSALRLAAYAQEILRLREQVLDGWEGVMIECHDPEGTHHVPGWKCRRCGRTVGAKGAPPPHSCVREFDRLRARVAELEEQAHGMRTAKRGP